MKERDWKTIFDQEIEETDRTDRGHGAVRFSTPQQLNMGTLMKSLIGWFRRFYALCLDQFCSLIGFHELLPELLFMAESGGRFLVTCETCPATCANNALWHQKGTRLHFFVVSTAAEEYQWWVINDSNKYVHCHSTPKPVLSGLLEMNLITITAHYIFVGRGYLQHEGGAWSGTPSL